MILTILLLLAGVLLWPAPKRQGWAPSGPGAPAGVQAGVGRESSHSEQTPRADAADAVVLLALALRSGGALVDSIEVVADVLQGPARRDLRTVAAAHRWGASPEEAWDLIGPGWRPAAIACAAADRAGIAPADLLLRAARQIRDRETEDMAQRLQRVGVLLVLPLGAFFLPGFVATTVVPVVLHLLRSAT